MTTAMIEDARFITLDRRRALDVITRHEPAFGVLGLMMLALMAPTLFAYTVDERTFQGVNVWLKPLKFQFSLAVYFLTLAFFARWLPAATRDKRWYRVFSASAVLAAVIEILWIGGAAAMGTSSHFNPTAFGQAIYGAMGAAAVLITSVSAVYAWQIARNGALRLPPTFRESVVLGLALTLPLTLLTAGVMSSMGSHWVGGAQAGSEGLALMGWARDGGDLRVAHFFATHAMHFLPVFGLLSVALFGPHERRPLRIVAAVFSLFVVWVFAQALAGSPFLPALG